MYTVYGMFRYQINDKFEIIKKDQTIPDLEIREDGKIGVEIYNRYKFVDKEWLYYVSKYRPRFPYGYEHEIFNLNYKRIYASKTWMNVAYFNEPVHYKELPGYVLLPADPLYVVDRTGDIINTHTGDPILYFQDGGYPSTKLFTTFTRRVHRLVAMAWIQNDDYENKPFIDHIDGDRTNCNVKNLRWVSQRENINYAVENGSFSQAKPVIVKNVLNGEVFKLPSVSKALEKIGYTKGGGNNKKVQNNKLFITDKGHFEISHIKNISS